ncbi:unnamed protein product [Pleuronectes platessa]|uniref:Uncharacterized protein n=1 Tax=Pleuronectes platessa TaxID=8262 RepID=A0A9N7VP06_PLEPL|nr:unnamed protein product [Pleuronectes platessa]
MHDVCQVTLMLLTPRSHPNAIPTPRPQRSSSRTMREQRARQHGPTKSVLRLCVCVARCCVQRLLLCVDASGLAALVHSAGFTGFLARPHAEWRRPRLDPWLNTDYVFSQPDLCQHLEQRALFQFIKS